MSARKVIQNMPQYMKNILGEQYVDNEKLEQLRKV